MKNKILVLSLVATFLISFSALAKPLETSPSEAKLEKIADNCGSIRQSLKLLQRSDSRARSYFGAIYETASSKYITPLNLRLVKNDLSSVSMINLQTSLASTRASFSSDFIDYSRSLEELIALDCRLEPEVFYEKLLETREKRTKVASDMKTINDLLVNSVKAAEKIKEGIDD
ncbi:hypothetical protein IJ380_02035 [Candidatus Saccharibacteria bacterium]|nr:hypothetical protein [Candidatus Saccharibacteria bacterium]